MVQVSTWLARAGKFVALLAVGGMAVGQMAFGQAAAADLMDQAKKEGLRVAFYNFVPYAYEKDDGEIVGTDVDTLRAVLGEMGVEIASAKATEWGNLIPGLKAGRFDVVAAGMFVTPKRCEQVMFSEPVFGIQQTLIVPKGNPEGVVDYGTIAEKGLTVAAISGSAHVGYAEASGIAADKIMQIPDNPTAIAAVRAGRADVYALSVPGARELVKSVPEQDFEMVTPFSEVAGKLAMPHGAFAFRKEDSAFVEAFNTLLTARVTSDSHVETFVTHGMQPDEMPIKTTAELCAGG